MEFRFNWNVVDGQDPLTSEPNSIKYEIKKNGENPVDIDTKIGAYLYYGFNFNIYFSGFYKLNLDTDLNVRGIITALIGLTNIIHGEKELFEICVPVPDLGLEFPIFTEKNSCWCVYMH